MVVVKTTLRTTTPRCLLMLNMKQLSTKLRNAKSNDSSALISKFEEIKTLYDEFNETTSAVSHPAEINELTDGVANQNKQCVNLVDKLVSKFCDNPTNVEENDADEMKPSDSVSQVGTETAASWITASTSANASVRQIEVKRKRAELLAKRELELARALAEVEATVKAAQAKAAEAEARFRIEQAKLDAEEKLVLFERGSSISSGSRRSKVKSVTKLRIEIRAKGGSFGSIIGSKIKSSLNRPVTNDTLYDSRPFANAPVIKSKIEPTSFRQKANEFCTKLEEPVLVEATKPITVKDYSTNLIHYDFYGHLNP